MIKNLVIGFGSEILSDRAIIHKMKKDIRADYSGKVDFTCELINSLDLIRLFEGYTNLLILDAVKNSDLEIGAMRYYSLAEYKPSLHLENYHDSSIVETIETAKRLGFHVPDKIGIVAINVKEIYTLNTQCSQELSRKHPELVQ